jgi:hypothetical protein
MRALRNAVIWVWDFCCLCLRKDNHKGEEKSKKKKKKGFWL